MKKSFAYSKIELLQFILFIALLLVPAEGKRMFAWWLCAAVAFEWTCIVLLELLKGRTIKGGDIVQLKSGGPKMVAENSDDQLGWWCHWFDETGKRQSMHFRAQMLNRA